MSSILRTVILTQLLPGEISMNEDTYTNTQRDCIQSLKKAADRISKSPTIREYRELGLTPSAEVIKETFGTWNAAKRAADLSLRTNEGQTRVEINETYFETIDTNEKAYWLGCLFCYSSQSDPETSNRVLQLGRSGENRYYVEAFADAVDSEYSVNESRTGGSTQVTTVISNQTFIETLREHGLTDSANRVTEFPTVPDAYEHAFMRAVLENLGNVVVGNGGWEIRVRGKSQQESIREWAESVGVKKEKITESNNKHILYIPNTFDAATVFEAAWPQGLETTPTHAATARRYAERIATEHHYPENLSFTPVENTTQETDNGKSTSQSSPDPAETPKGESSASGATVSEPPTEALTRSVTEITVPLSLDVVLLLRTLETTQGLSTSKIVTNALRSYVGDLLSSNTSPVETHSSVDEVVDCTLRLPEELVRICDTQADSIPVRTILESAIQYEYADTADTVKFEFHTAAVDDIPRDTTTIVNSLSECLFETSSFSVE